MQMENCSDLEELKSLWTEQQRDCKEKVIEVDSEALASNDWQHVGGLDISFIVGDETNACACYVILNRQLEVVYQDVQMVEMTAPYIPGFLAFREAHFLIALISKQRQTVPELTPDILMVDGNGLLHPRQCGIACHIGVETSIPTLGVAKNLHQIQEFGQEFTRDNVRQRFESLTDQENFITLKTFQGKVLGAAVKTSADCNNPIFVSVGSGVSLETGVNIVSLMSKYRIPEPTRQADIISREYLRNEINKDIIQLFHHHIKYSYSTYKLLNETQMKLCRNPNHYLTKNQPYFDLRNFQCYLKKAIFA